MNMLEIWLAVSILAGVVLFSLFIALGNERQRRELELLRKEAQAWALRDLAIKRSRLTAEIQVGEPCVWLNQVAACVLREDPGLESVQSTRTRRRSWHEEATGAILRFRHSTRRRCERGPETAWVRGRDLRGGSRKWRAGSIPFRPNFGGPGQSS